MPLNFLVSMHDRPGVGARLHVHSGFADSAGRATVFAFSGVLLSLDGEDSERNRECVRGS